METPSKRTDVICVLDRSGSMQSVASDAIGGFNAFLARQKIEPGRAYLTMILFDHEYRVLHDAEPIGTVPYLSDSVYIPRGRTALLDAIGQAIAVTTARVRSSQESERTENVIVCILTDGLENASREFTRRQIVDLIAQRKAEGWEFVYLAADMAGIAEGQTLGMNHDESVQYLKSPFGMADAFNSIDKRVAKKRRTPR